MSAAWFSSADDRIKDNAIAKSMANAEPKMAFIDALLLLGLRGQAIQGILRFERL